jgi:hypothetical protein
MSTFFPAGASRQYQAPASSTTQNLRQSSTIMELQASLERQNLMVQTLARLLIAKGIVSEEELDQWMAYVDGLDGAVDGKLRKGRVPRACPDCNRMNPPNAVKCQYCSTDLPVGFLEKPEG